MTTLLSTHVVGVAPLGDLHDDGYADAAAVTEDSKVYILSGGPNGFSAAVQPAGISSMVTAGDVNGDGYVDTLVDAAGGAQVWLTAIHDPTAAHIIQLAVGTQRGVCVGDVNGDGYADVTTRGTENGMYANRVYVYRGGASGTEASPGYILSAGADDTRTDFGEDIDGADVDGDGYSDIVISAYSIGKVFVFRGGPSGVNSTPAAVFSGDAAGGAFAQNIAVSDIDGDGFSDVLVGAYLAAETTTSRLGKVYLYRGSSTSMALTPSHILTPPAGRSRFGVLMAGADGGV
jgi:hypothetical protein